MPRFILFILSLSFFASGEELLPQIEQAKNMIEVNKIVDTIFESSDYKESSKAIEIYLDKQNISSMRSVSKMLIFSDLAKFLKVLSLGDDLSPEFVKWLSNYKRRSDLLYNITRSDDLSEVLNILQKIHKHDPSEVDKYWNLALATSLVWDTERKNMHHQMGSKTMSYSWEITALYDYFKKIYKRGAKLSYSKLSVQELVFVVAVDVPLEELHWALKNCSGSARAWAKRYFEIKYNTTRLNAERYQWDQGMYSLANIKELGGICVDQAYFTVMSARANGIPAMYFSGMGRGATDVGHAWAGVMKDGREWDLEIGRYSQGNYGTGKARDPQTNMRLTDHELDFKSNAIFASEQHINSLRMTSLARHFSKMKKDDCAEYLYKKALTSSKMNIKAYAGLKQIYAKLDDPKKFIQVMKAEMTVFKKYPDFVYELGTELVAVLNKNGQTSEAKTLQKALVKKVEDRYDLAESATQNMVKSLYENGKASEGRRAFERYIDDQPDFYNTLDKDILLYYELTKANDQSKYATRFLKKMMKGGRERQAVVKEYLYKAYMDIGDERNAKKIL
ncbi:transglutaminase-like domain-containing protein [Lentisphaera profundi]|uniref:Transglutaminase-like domain-containing protein n=1 Tax=Lentisphaera profundi TaxID=1658616 RepID=A0ABY7VUD7_9BACT|nr:transglutaminase-like domain-containing protein [Lentisphaera profundi]WDE96369.1 transglutaminase-like domain-containing protein [Lentisphaera profundi]